MNKYSYFSLNLPTEKFDICIEVIIFYKVRIPTPLMISFTVFRDKLKTELGFYTKVYGDTLLRRIGFCHPIVIYESGGKCFLLIYLLKVNVQKKS